MDATAVTTVLPVRVLVNRAPAVNCNGTGSAIWLFGDRLWTFGVIVLRYK